MKSENVWKKIIMNKLNKKLECKVLVQDFPGTRSYICSPPDSVLKMTSEVSLFKKNKT